MPHPDADLDRGDDDPRCADDADDPPGVEPFDSGDDGDRDDESGLDEEPGADDGHRGILRLLLVLRLAGRLLRRLLGLGLAGDWRG